MMLGLRLRDGVDLNAFAARYAVRGEDKYVVEIARYTDAGLLERTENRLRLTPRGLFLANEVMAAFLP